MDRHFTLPITIAAALHLGLLFGIRSGHSSENAVSDKTSWTRGNGIPPTIEIVQKVADTPDDPRAAQPTSGGESRPEIPEFPPVDDGKGIPIPVPILPPGTSNPGPIWTITPPGTGGPGEAIGGGPGPIGVNLLDKSPHARVQIAPEYPADAKVSGRTGDVVVEFVVDESGRVHDARVVQSNDSTFDSAAVRAVSKWRFEPGTQHGRIVSFRIAVPIVFRLNDT